jgi:type I restriction enzyme M protein
MVNFSEHVSFIWSIAEILRGNYKQSEYGKVVLPFTVLRRLDCVLEASKDAVLAKAASLPAGIDSAMAEVMLNQASGHSIPQYQPLYLPEAAG